MNTLNKDRNILKRLVESYGKKDVLNFVRHLNESVNYQYTVVADTANVILDEYGEYEWNEDLINDLPQVAKKIENVYAPGKIEVNLSSSDAWPRDAYIDVYHFTIEIKFNNDLTQSEAENLLEDWVLPGAGPVCDADEDLSVRYRNGEQITLRDIEYYANGGPHAGDDEWENGPTYSGDYIALAKLAGIRK